MTNNSDDPMWPPAMWASAMQDASEDAVDQQQKLFEQFLEASSAGMPDASPLSQIGQMGMGSAVFKTRVQSGGRISIPDAEREALGIDEGDIVQTVVIPLTAGDNNE
jgi:hypothetical protein